MSRDYYREQNAFEAIARSLKREGWTVHHHQLLSRGDLVLCLRASEWYVEYYSGRQPERQVVDDIGACRECNGSGEHPNFRSITYAWAIANPAEFRRFSIANFGMDSGQASRDCFAESGIWKCSLCVAGRVKRLRNVPDGNPLPTFHATPKGSNWHLERGGEIVTTGRVPYGFDFRSVDGTQSFEEQDAKYAKAMSNIRRGIATASVGLRGVVL